MRFLLFICCTIIPIWGDNYFNTKCDISAQRCFEYVSSPAAYSDAEDICIEKQGHLVSIANGFVGATIAESATHAFTMPNFSDFWIGANFIFNNRWSWTDGTDFSYSNWAPEQPANNGSAAMQLKTNYWISSDPTISKPFVCEIAMKPMQYPSPPSCPKTYQCELGWTLFNQFCYKPFFNATFADAEAVCQRHSAHLTSIHSKEENQLVTEISLRGVNETDIDDVTWIGLYRLNSPWMWTDGTKVNYTIWGGLTGIAPHGAEYDCTTLFSDGWYGLADWYRKWNNWLCDVPQRNFVCKKPAS